jgi:hypothetical protein
VPLFTQVKIQDTITIYPSRGDKLGRLRSIDVASPTVITAKLTYWACGSSATLSVVGPCDSYFQSVTGTPSPDFNTPGQAVITVIVYDQGNYNFNITQHIDCPPVSPCGFASGNCREILTITDNHDYNQTYSPPGGGAVYVNNSSNDCASNDLQPQAFDLSSFDIYRDNQQYMGKDQNGNSCLSNIIFCADLNQTGILEFGNTRTFDQTPSFGNSCVLVSNYNDINGCKDLQANKWRLKIDALRVPLISDYCIPSGFADLGDGSNPTILSQYIYTCNRYNAVMETLDYLMGITGRRQFAYMFSSAVKLHEDTHISNVELLLRRSYNNFFKKMYSNSPQVLPNQCLNEILNTSTPEINKSLVAIYNEGLTPDQEQKSEEFASANARFEYLNIRDRINNWAIQAHPEWFATFHCVSF